MVKAIVRERYGGPEVLHCAEIERSAPGPGQVLLEVVATSTNTADLEDLRGAPLATRVMSGLRRPRARVPGLDVAGRVVEVGSGVTRFAPGDEVWGDLIGGGRGSFAEFVTVPEAVVHPVPDGLDLEQAATIPHSGLLALQALRAGGGRLRSGARVAINGAGGCVGPFAVQIAKAAGAEVTAIDHGDKLAFLDDLGADRTIDHRAEDVTRSGESYDLIVDIAATRSVVPFRRVIADGGAYVHIARSLQGFFGAIAIGGLLSIGRSRRMGVFMWRPSDGEGLAELARMVLDGRLQPVIERRYALSETPDALRRHASGEARGKLVIVP